MEEDERQGAVVPGQLPATPGQRGEAVECRTKVGYAGGTRTGCDEGLGKEESEPASQGRGCNGVA